MRHRDTPIDQLPRHAAQNVRQLYLELASARAATIQDAIERSEDLPDPPAVVLALAAAELTHVTGVVHAASAPTARAARLSRGLIAEAVAHDPDAGALAEQALDELEDEGSTTPGDAVPEAVDSLAWACAVLRRQAEFVQDSEDGNAAQLELAWLCLYEAAELLIALDWDAIRERERYRHLSTGGGRDRPGGGRAAG